MQATLINLGWVIGAYLLGSLSFAVIISRAMGLNDPRTYGSKNPGATNVLRSGNKAAAVLTLLFDAVKGWVPVFFALRAELSDGWVAAVALAAFLGHLYPVFFRFVGGKGVATALGVLVGINPLFGLATLSTWIIIAAFFRFSSLAALVASIFAPVTYLLWFGGDAIGLAVLIMSGLLIWRHRQNISNLMNGKEKRLGEKA
ncbi:MAG TPA: glycerol-3-phosphate 1-O-acyltransferase PlsY [Burkholderiaceae bacterium]|nr:glycerol-3-phosphate 1-O-acyltransferase PlsY [Burkholderiaceae bacterium]